MLLSPAPPVTRIHLSAADRPARLTGFEATPEFVDVAGSLEARRAVAIVGSRKATPEAYEYAKQLASKLARKGAVIVSGGALGIDRAAHEGALDAGGRTWCVLPTSYPEVTPKPHYPLVEAITAEGGTVMWIGNGGALTIGHFLQRNTVLVGLSDAVIVIQAARERSGSLHSARSARKLGRTLFVVAPSPWLNREAYAGNVLELGEGYASPVIDDDILIEQLGFRDEPGSIAAAHELATPVPSGLDSAELAVLAALHTASPSVLHVDEIVSKTALTYSAAASALLTLCLDAVVVEGPGGFYRRRPAGLAAAGAK